MQIGLADLPASVPQRGRARDTEHARHVAMLSLV